MATNQPSLACVVIVRVMVVVKFILLFAVYVVRYVSNLVLSLRRASKFW